MSAPTRPIDPLADELEWLTGVRHLGYRTATTINLGVKDLETLITMFKDAVKFGFEPDNDLAIGTWIRRDLNPQEVMAWITKHDHRHLKLVKDDVERNSLT